MTIWTVPSSASETVQVSVENSELANLLAARSAADSASQSACAWISNRRDSLCCMTESWDREPISPRITTSVSRTTTRMAPWG